MNASSYNKLNFFESNPHLTLKVNEELKIFDIKYNQKHQLFAEYIDINSLFSSFTTQDQIDELCLSIERVFTSHAPEARMVTLFNHESDAESYWTATVFPRIKQNSVHYVFIKLENISKYFTHEAEDCYPNLGTNIKKLIPLTNPKKINKTLKLHDTRFRLLVDNIKDYAIFMLDSKGFITSWNRGAEFIKQYKADEIIGQHFSVFYTEEARKSKHPEKELKLAIKNGRYEEEGWRIKKDGTTFWANVIITPIYDSQRKLVGFGKVTRDLTERKKLEQIKSEFISVISHELRTPLTAIIGSLKIIEQMIINTIPANYLSLFQIAIKNCERLSRLLNNMLDVEKIKGTHLQYDFQIYDLSLLIKEAIDLNQTYATQYKVSIQCINLQPVYVRVDKDRLIQVLTNLCSNAIKFSPAQSEVIISMKKEPHAVTVEISDEGPGIPENFKNRIFQQFSQSDSTSYSNSNGFGLGLYISKAIIEQSKGQLNFHENNKKGTTFYFTLPIIQPLKLAPSDL